MIIDKSAILAIINLDEKAEEFAIKIEEAEKIMISAVNYFEVSVWLEKKFGERGLIELDNFMRKAKIEVSGVDANTIEYVREAYRVYGKSSEREKGLSSGDCFAYGLAKFHNLPLLFNGENFTDTDIIAA